MEMLMAESSFLFLFMLFMFKKLCFMFTFLSHPALMEIFLLSTDLTCGKVLQIMNSFECFVGRMMEKGDDSDYERKGRSGEGCKQR
jgi:hypothetical protein